MFIYHFLYASKDMEGDSFAIDPVSSYFCNGLMFVCMKTALQLSFALRLSGFIFVNY